MTHTTKKASGDSLVRPGRASVNSQKFLSLEMASELGIVATSDNGSVVYGGPDLLQLVGTQLDFRCCDSLFDSFDARGAWDGGDAFPLSHAPG